MAGIPAGSEGGANGRLVLVGNLSWQAVFDEALDWVYPSRCGLCGLLRDHSPCEVCASEMEPARPNFLGEPSQSPLSFRACVFAYRGRAAQAVRRLKYGRSTSLGSFMSNCVARRIGEVADQGALVVPVPLHPSRRAIRGFNQAEMCISSLAEFELDPKALSRTRATRPQAGLSLKERELNLQGAFTANKAVAGRNVLLVDDVVTSGYTARSCASVLKSQGALSVGIVAFCGNLD